MATDDFASRRILMSLFSLVKSGYGDQKTYYFKINDDDNNSPQIIHKTKEKTILTSLEWKSGLENNNSSCPSNTTVEFNA